jgi:hypothetical protein
VVGRIYSHLRNQWMGALALFLVLTGGAAYAAFDPVGNDGDIDACFQRKSGDLDLQKGKKCGKGEKSVAWNQVGPRGEMGERGEQGSPGVSGLVRVRTPSTLQASESVKFAMAICPAGKRVIGSGADIRAGVDGDPPNQTTNMVINEVIPSEETVVPGTVTVRAYENEPTTDEWGVTAFALCANVS